MHPLCRIDRVIETFTGGHRTTWPLSHSLSLKQLGLQTRLLWIWPCSYFLFCFSLCKGLTLYTHIHMRKEKFALNRSVIIASQIAQVGKAFAFTPNTITPENIQNDSNGIVCTVKLHVLNSSRFGRIGSQTYFSNKNLNVFLVSEHIYNRLFFQTWHYIVGFCVRMLIINSFFYW